MTSISEQSSSRSTRKSSISFRAPHLSEFYKFVSGHSELSEPAGNAANGASNAIASGEGFSNGKRRMSSSSLDTGVSLTPSILDLPTIINSKDRSDFEQAISQIKVASLKYEQSLAQVSNAASDFGSALENLARFKGSESHSNELMTCSGLMFLISNHQQVLSSTIEKTFHKPLVSIVVNFQKKTKENDRTYNAQLKHRVRSLRQLETLNYKISKAKKRNMLTYKDTLKKINDQIDSIDSLKYGYYDSLLRLIDDTNSRIIKNCCTVAKAEFEIHENIARKGWSGGGMDELLADCPDPFTDESSFLADIEEEESPDDTLDGDVSKLSIASSPPQASMSTSPSISSLFHTKISNTKAHTVKHQLINTKDALAIQNEIFSPSSSTAFPNNPASPISIGSSAVDQRSNHTVTGKSDSKSEEVERVDNPDKIVASSKKKTENGNTVRESEDGVPFEESGDDNSFSLPLPTSFSGSPDPPKHLYRNAWSE